MTISKKISKLKTIRVLPKSATRFVRFGLVVAFVGVLYQPVKSQFFSDNVTLRHVDIETGISCLLTKGGSVSFECEKDPYVGMSLDEVSRDKKIWNYALPSGESVVIEREGLTNGVRLLVKSDKLPEKLNFLLPYKNIDLGEE